MNTPFGQILTQAVAAVPDAQGCVFADWEGEAIDWVAPGRDGTQVRLVGAHWGIVLQLARAAAAKLRLGSPLELLVQTSSGFVIMHAVTDEYCVVLSVGSESHLGRARRALAHASEKLRQAM